jgi:hypothetical protein
LCEFIQFPWEIVGKQKERIFIFIYLSLKLFSFLDSPGRRLCVAIFSQLAKGDIFAPDLDCCAAAAAGPRRRKRVNLGRKRRKTCEGQQLGARAGPAIAKGSFSLSLSQTALCVCSGEDGLGPSLSLFSLSFIPIFILFFFLRPPTIFSASSPCNFRCQQQQQQHAQTRENAFVLFRSPGVDAKKSIFSSIRLRI